MADKKISQLTAATTPLGGTEVLPIVQSGATVKATVANIVGAGTSPGSFTTATASLGMFAPFAFAGNANNSFNAYATNAAINYGAVFTGGLDGSGIPYAQISVWNNAKVDVVTMRSSGDMTVNTGNVVIGTAAKGVNFTANTPAAGMTSQLLNWYEEGTYAPTISAAVGTITTSSATAYYTRIGRLVTVSARVQITTAGTGAGSLIMSVPFNIANRSVGSSRETALTGYGGTAWASSGTDLYIQQYDNNSMIASGADITVTMNYMT